MRRDPLGFLQRLAREQGDMAQFDWGHQRTWLLAHPDLIKEVFMTYDRSFSKWFAVERLKEVLGNGLFVSEGEYHSRQRRLAQPLFHTQRIREYAQVMLRTAAAARDKWTAGSTIDIAEEMNRIALINVAKTLFSADVSAEAGEIRGALGEILDLFERAALARDEQERYDAARARLDETVLRLIQERRALREDKGDLLSMLLHAEYELDGKQLDDRQIRDEAMTIFIAGHETTATAMTWAWHLLGTHPAEQAAFHKELDAVLGKRAPDPDDFMKLVYTGMVFNETLRLYPPVWAIGRQALEPVTIAGREIARGDVVILSQYITHHDGRFYTRPERFVPERWTAEARANRPRYSYFPFSGGSRSCLGEGFATMETVLTLATIGQRWRLEPDPSHPVDVQAQLTLRPKSGMRMRVCPKS